jgi:hypothetical protein
MSLAAARSSGRPLLTRLLPDSPVEEIEVMLLTSVVPVRSILKTA